MLKDIPQLKVEDLAIAIVPREGDDLEDVESLWDVFLFNFSEEAILNVLVSSKGYGEIEGENRRTTVLRHFFEEVPALGFISIEPIQAKLFGLTNEYWVSFNQNEHMYDKNYVFVQGSIEPSNFTTIPFINRPGVMIR